MKQRGKVGQLVRARAFDGRRRLSQCCFASSYVRATGELTLPPTHFPSWKRLHSVPSQHWVMMVRVPMAYVGSLMVTVVASRGTHEIGGNILLPPSWTAMGLRASGLSTQWVSVPSVRWGVPPGCEIDPWRRRFGAGRARPWGRDTASRTRPARIFS